MGELIAAGGLHLLGFFQKLVPVAVVSHAYLNAQIALWNILSFCTAVRAMLHKPNLRSFALQHLAYNLLDASLMLLVVR
jgi:hypothetical protein